MQSFSLEPLAHKPETSPPANWFHGLVCARGSHVSTSQRSRRRLRPSPRYSISWITSSDNHLASLVRYYWSPRHEGAASECYPAENVDRLAFFAKRFCTVTFAAKVCRLARSEVSYWLCMGYSQYRSAGRNGLEGALFKVLTPHDKLVSKDFRW